MVSIKVFVANFMRAHVPSLGMGDHFDCFQGNKIARLVWVKSGGGLGIAVGET